MVLLLPVLSNAWCTLYTHIQRAFFTLTLMEKLTRSTKGRTDSEQDVSYVDTFYFRKANENGNEFESGLNTTAF